MKGTLVAVHDACNCRGYAYSESLASSYFSHAFHLRTPQGASLVFLSLRFAYFHFVAKFVLAHKDTERKETGDVVVFLHVFPCVLSRPIPLLVGVGVWPCVSLCVLIEEKKMIMNASSCVCKLLGLQKT